MDSLDAGHASPLSVQNTPNAVTNGVDAPLPVNGDVKHDSAASPTAQSPATPVSTLNVSNVKIDIDYHEQESDARNEPMHIKKVEPIEPPTVVHTTIEQDVNMDEPHNESPMNGVNGHADRKDGPVHDNDAYMATPTQTPLTVDSSMQSINGGASSPAGSTPVDYRDHDHDAEDQPPPAKRARMHSDADQASFTLNTPPPASASPPPISAVVSNPGTPAPTFSPGGTALNNSQYKFAQSTIRSLKKMKDASPFIKPVDYVALNIPHYPQVIKHPMDFSTVERKLTASNPTKLDPNPNNPRYHTIEEFVNDVRLIFQNCITFNGPDHVITQMGKRVEEVFDKQLKHMPPAEQVKPPPPKKATPPPPPPVSAPPQKKAAPTARRPSTSVPVIRRSDELAGRPKREIHPPPPKDLAYTDAPKKPRKAKGVRNDGTADQLKFCLKLLNDLHKKQWYAIAHPFYEPVDWVALELPTYPKLIKKPMDLSTMRKKLEAGQYPTAQKFFDDFKLMIRNCFVFNPAGTPVNQAGIELQRLFDEKWKQLPPLRELMSEDEEDDEEDDSEDERQRAIADLESRIEEMRNNVAALKSTKKEKKKKEKKEKPPVASSSKPTTKQAKAPSKKKSSKKAITENDALTFEQKKDLSESIAKLDEARLEKVIQIIHEGVPEIRDSTDEIELEIDLLPPAVLTKLYNFVIRPMRQPPVKRNRTGKGTGTGGLKRKSMDEDVEAEKIRLLEERMALFNQQENGGASFPSRQAESDHSSDSSDSSDGSGSDSD